MKRSQLVRRSSLRRTGIRRGGSVLRSVPLRQVSRKRASDNRTYTAGKKQFLADNPICQRCRAARSVDLHHRANRSTTQKAFLDPANWVALCRPCHDWVGVNREAAVAEGFAQWGWDYRDRGAA